MNSNSSSAFSPLSHLLLLISTTRYKCHLCFIFEALCVWIIVLYYLFFHSCWWLYIREEVHNLIQVNNDVKIMASHERVNLQRFTVLKARKLILEYNSRLTDYLTLMLMTTLVMNQKQKTFQFRKKYIWELLWRKHFRQWFGEAKK